MELREREEKFFNDSDSYKICMVLNEKQRDLVNRLGLTNPEVAKQYNFMFAESMSDFYSNLVEDYYTEKNWDFVAPEYLNLNMDDLIYSVENPLAGWGPIEIDFEEEHSKSDETKENIPALISWEPIELDDEDSLEKLVA